MLSLQQVRMEGGFFLLFLFPHFHSFSSFIFSYIFVLPFSHKMTKCWRVVKPQYNQSIFGQKLATALNQWERMTVENIFLWHESRNEGMKHSWKNFPPIVGLKTDQPG